MSLLRARPRALILLALLGCGAGAARGVELADPMDGAEVPVALTPATRAPSREAWWTGSLLSASPDTLPVGRWLVEPYVVDSRADAAFDAEGHRHAVSSVTRDLTAAYVMYGLADGVSIGMQPRFLLGAGAADASVGPAVGDLTLMFQMRLARRMSGSWSPAMSLVLSETLPTGRYDRLRAGAIDGTGAGVHRTDLGFYAQSVGDVLQDHPLRVRLNATIGWSDHAELTDVSVYGTAEGFRGRAAPGRWVSVDAAFELGLSQHWVLALDLAYQGQASTIVEGRIGAAPDVVRSREGTSRAWAVAPAVEYNFDARIGLIAGIKANVAGRNAPADRVAALALNMFF